MPDFGFDFDGAGTVFAVLRAVVRSQHANFGNGIQTGIGDHRGVAAVVLIAAAVDFPVVVFGAAAVHAVGDRSYTRARLVDCQTDWWFQA